MTSAYDHWKTSGPDEDILMDSIWEEVDEKWVDGEYNEDFLEYMFNNADWTQPLQSIIDDFLEKKVEQRAEWYRENWDD